MGQNNIGDLTMGKMTTALPVYTNDVDLYPDIVKKWGLSFLINTAKTPEGRSAGSLAWAGLANTYFWIDPARNVAGVILMQLLPFADGKAWRPLRDSSAGFMPGSMPGRRRRREHLLETVIASEAKQSIATQKGRMDCFVACAPRNDVAGIASRSLARAIRRRENIT